MSLNKIPQQKKCSCKCGCAKTISNVYYEICIFCTLGKHKKPR